MQRFQTEFPANTRRLANVDSMLAHRLRRWPNIESTFAKRLVFTMNMAQMM